MNFYKQAEDRLLWAERHIAKLERCVFRYTVATTILQSAVERIEWRDPYYVRVVTHRAWPETETPYYLRLLAGDAIHGLRATVDNLVWGLGQERGCNSGISLFFRETSESYDKTASQMGYVKLPDSVKYWMESQQKFSTANGSVPSLLYKLNDLWNRDKHKAPTLVTAASPSVVVGDEMVGQIDCLTVTTDENEVVAISEGDGDLNPSFKLEVRFNNENETAVSLLRRLSRYIRKDVLPLFQSFVS